MVILMAVFLLSLLEITLRDIRSYEISDLTLLLLAGGGVVYAYGCALPPYGALTGGGLLGLVYIVSRGGIGLGDVKLAAAAGLWLSWPEMLLAALLAFWLGGLCAAWLMIGKKRSGKAMLPFAPFLAAGIVISFFQGAPLLTYYWQLVRL